MWTWHSHGWADGRLHVVVERCTDHYSFCFGCHPWQ